MTTKGLKGFKKGYTPWNKGKFLSEEIKEKIRKSLKGKLSGKNHPFFGKHHTEETRNRISKSKTGNSPSWLKGLKGYKVGKEHYNWKGGEKTKKVRRCFYERMREIKKNGNGGSHTLKEWDTLKAQYNWTCPCCGKKEPEIKLTEDHIIPISKGGSNNIENIQPLCRSCNSKKSNKYDNIYESK